MLVMERLYPMDFRAYEYEKRELWLDVFESDYLSVLSNRKSKNLSISDNLCCRVSDDEIIREAVFHPCLTEMNIGEPLVLVAFLLNCG